MSGGQESTGAAACSEIASGSHDDRDGATQIFQPVSDDRDVSGCCELPSCMSDTQAAQNRLEEAPTLSLPSFQPNIGVMQDMGTRQESQPSQATALGPRLNTQSGEDLIRILSENIDSGSLLGNSLKTLLSNHVFQNTQPGMRASNPPSIVNTNQFTATEINNVNASSDVSSNISSEDNITKLVRVPLSKDYNSTASSYMKMTNGSNINERLRDFQSQIDDASSSFSSNNLGAMVDHRNQGNKNNLPINIQASMSMNEDFSETFAKSVTKSTQTEGFKDQNTDSMGGAASESSGVHSMSSASASSMPSDEILVRKLKRPVIQWLQTKLETKIGKAWQDLADLYDWDYERITDFETSCPPGSGKSPFCLLLAEPEFQMYRLRDLKDDLFKLPRKDILHDLDDRMRQYYK